MVREVTPTYVCCPVRLVAYGHVTTPKLTIHALSIGHVTWDEYRVKFLASKGFNEKEMAEKIKNNEDLKLDEESKYTTLCSNLFKNIPDICLGNNITEPNCLYRRSSGGFGKPEGPLVSGRHPSSRPGAERAGVPVLPSPRAQQGNAQVHGQGDRARLRYVLLTHPTNHKLKAAVRQHCLRSLFTQQHDQIDVLDL